MIRWNNDYSHGAHPAVLKALTETNGFSFEGYGLDECCQRAAEEIRTLLKAPDADIHFLTGGTQTNMTVISAALRPYQGVLSPVSGHIHAHETGAVEHTGHKILPLSGKNGKLTAEAVRAAAEGYRSSDVREHIVQPKMVYLSFPTEVGTLYNRKELEALRAVCDEYGMYLFLDGARLGYGLGARGNDVTLPDLARLTDVFYIGGTKCGALFGEAVVITHPALKEDFRSSMKQNGGMLAKGWLLGLQFDALLRGGLYFDITHRADEMALTLRRAFEDRKIPLYVESVTNQQFVILTSDQMERLSRRHIFSYQERLGDDRHCVRFCTSWSTREEDLQVLLEDIQRL